MTKLLRIYRRIFLYKALSKAINEYSQELNSVPLGLSPQRGDYVFKRHSKSFRVSFCLSE